MTDLSRRKLLTGFWQAGKQPSSATRPPWSVSESDFIAGCTRCQNCVAACETGVLVAGVAVYFGMLLLLGLRLRDFARKSLM